MCSAFQSGDLSDADLIAVVCAALLMSGRCWPQGAYDQVSLEDRAAKASALASLDSQILIYQAASATPRLSIHSGMGAQARDCEACPQLAEERVRTALERYGRSDLRSFALALMGRAAEEPLGPN